MTELVFRAKVVGLHSNRHPPLGYEDSWKREYEKDSVETEAPPRGTEGENFRPVEPRPTGKKGRKGTTVKGTKTSPWYRFMRDPSENIEKGVIEESLSRNIYGARGISTLPYDDKTWDFPNYRADAGTCRVEIKNKPLAKKEPTP